MSRSPGSRSLTWKLEDPSGLSHDDDLGRAWVDGNEPGQDLALPGLNGRWITRREARAVAQEHGLCFFEDDGSDRSYGRASSGGSGLDVEAINQKLRAAGISNAELRIEETPGFNDVLVWGTMLRLLPAYARDADSPITTAMVSMSPSEALDALDLLAPNWRSAETSG